MLIRQLFGFHKQGIKMDNSSFYESRQLLYWLIVKELITIPSQQLRKN